MSCKSTIIRVRFRESELAALDALRSELNSEAMNRSEAIRLLVLREYRRRQSGRSVVRSSEVSSEHRIGRPVEERGAA